MKRSQAQDAITLDTPSHALLRKMQAWWNPPPDPEDPARYWTPSRMVQAWLIMAWGKASDGLVDRFGDARALLDQEDQGRTYQGLIKAFKPQGQQYLADLGMNLRPSLEQWTCPWPWPIFAVDGSRFDLPRTQANERAFDCAGKAGSAPQLFLTVLYHLGSRLPWAWRIGPGKASERHHLRQMLADLPALALLLADAGFVGYDLLAAILASGRHVLMRVGGNLHVLEELGYAVQERQGLVYLWPRHAQRQGRPPLVLRLIVLPVEKGEPMYLLTDLLEADQLSDAQAGELYRLRWGVELFYRSAKQTLEARKLRAHSPAVARLELAGLVAGLMLLGVLQRQAIEQQGTDAAPARASLAQGLKVVRRVIRPRAGEPQGPEQWWQALGQAVRDPYVRDGKVRRSWPRKKPKDPAPGPPKRRKATPEEVRLAQHLREQPRAA